MVKWFGKRWGFLCDDCEKIPVPVGESCSWCNEIFLPDDNGVQYSNGPLAHKNCFLRASIGSVAHLEGRCSCYVPGASETDDPGVSRRAAADAAVRLWERGNA